jgi:amidohydrolase
VSVSDLRTEAESLQAVLIEWRRDLHRRPELAWQERQTSDFVSRALADAGLAVRRGVGGTGVIGILQGERPGRTVMLRADMDALPIQELSDVPYRSEVPGVMHACGHDGHMAMALGAARLLIRRRAEIAGTCLLLFQPAEEDLGGAAAVMRDGGLENPKPDAIFGLHLWNPMPVGRVAAQAGPLMAAADLLRIKLHGRGGHGARPHEAVDAIATAGQVLSALQTIVSRNVDPQEAAVLTIGTVHGGSAFNIIAETVALEGTIRTFSAGVRETVLARLRVLLDGITAGMGARYELEIQPVAPPVVNDPAASEVARAAAVQIAGSSAVAWHAPLTGSEDFAEYQRLVPGCFMLLGSGNPDMGLNVEHHHPRFDFDESALPIGAALLAAVALRFLAQAGEPMQGGPSSHNGA